ncbi:Indoleamine 2,3-dioxygenase [Linderina pennispora]|uniref:Indoleamine 2,3-dioxygenase n=1 Tax=Linderina pennispora TaxID=61395 RepID=A0A1Y1W465_9FUNG|nr:Indoleamine 2,3-dioxygenase [Linderina pennispora]ORX68363.1 Indoleamine 2,3-dioxygenase [Linderina pennispora]
MPNYSNSKATMYSSLKLEDYDISPTNGFLPTHAPLTRLADAYYEPWEKIMDKFNQHILANRIRPLVRKMPVLDIDKLSTTAEYQRAFTILGFMAHAYVWGRNGAASEGASEFLPASISIPWVAVADILGMNPVICCAAVCHWNWQPLDEDAEDMMDIGNLGTTSWFYLVTTAIEAKGARGINAILDGIAGVETDDVARSLHEAHELLARMYERCDPYVFYWKIREFLAGWENMAEAGLPYGVLYEGVDDTDTFSLDNWQSLLRRFRKYAGGSAAQTPLLQAFDIALGIKHYPTGEKGMQGSVRAARERLAKSGIEQPPPANSYLVRMRDYMPGGHRRFLEDLAATCMIREYVLLTCSDALLAEQPNDQRAVLRLAYNRCVDLMRAFRDTHIMIVTRYIIAQAKRGPAMPTTNHPVPGPAKKAVAQGLARTVDDDGVVRGTGGTDAIQFLKQVRNETASSRIQ